MEIIKMPTVMSAGTTEQTLAALQRYVWQMAEELNFALEESRETEKKLTEKTDAALKQSGKQTPGASFGRIKDLIIKSAEIVEAYRTEITKTLYGKFVAESDFGKFQQQTQQRITETDELIQQNFTAIQEIQSDVDGITTGIREMNAYIRTGFLYEDDDGIKRYGVEIGEQAEKDGVTAFKKFARMVSDRLSFFDSNDIEVAYISDRKLYITYADCQEMTAKKISAESLMVGPYILEYGSDGHLTLS